MAEDRPVQEQLDLLAGEVEALSVTITFILTHFSTHMNRGHFVSMFFQDFDKATDRTRGTYRTGNLGELGVQGFERRLNKIRQLYLSRGGTLDP